MDWISAASAMDNVSRTLGHDAASRALAMHLKHGNLHLWCESYRIGNNEIQKSVPVEEGAIPDVIAVPVYFFGDLNENDSSNWDWASGVLSIEIMVASGLVPLEIVGAKFSHAQIKRLFGDLLPTPGDSANRAVGRITDSDRWGQFAAALAVLSLRDEIKPGQRKSEIYQAVADFLVKDRGRKTVLGFDAVSKCLTLLKGWGNGYPVVGDYDHKDTD